MQFLSPLKLLNKAVLHTISTIFVEQEILLVYVILVFKGQNKTWDSTLKGICSHYEVPDSLQGQVHPF